MSAATAAGTARAAIVKRADKAAGLAWTRDWRERHRPLFDAMDAGGAFADSAQRWILPA